MKEIKEEAAMPAVKDLSSRGGFRPRALLLCCLSAGVVLGSFIGFQLTKSVLSLHDLFYPRIYSLSLSHTCESLSPPPLPLLSCNCSSNCAATTSAHGLKDHTAHEGLWHSMSDEELFRQASTMHRASKHGNAARMKVAFMFLTRGRLPLRPLWEKFFRGHQSRFSIYLHTSPDYDGEPPEGSVFFGRRIPSKPVEWGRATMVDAERRLLANALLDLSNEWFILLSETCLPLYNLSTVYDYLKGSTHSFVSSFDDPRRVGRGRYSKRMWPVVSIQDWRKGSQWFEVQRTLAMAIVSDREYYPVFSEHCRPPCYMDEHYVPTLVTKLFPELNANRSLTWVDWSRGGSHPAAFRHRDVSEALLGRMRRGSRCVHNGEPSSVCFLFARKFEAGALGPLLKLVPSLLGVDR